MSFKEFVVWFLKGLAVFEWTIYLVPGSLKIIFFLILRETTSAPAAAAAAVKQLTRSSTTTTTFQQVGIGDACQGNLLAEPTIIFPGLIN